MDFQFNDDTRKNYIHDVYLSDINTCEAFYDRLQMLFIELLKSDKHYHIKDEMSKVSNKNNWTYLPKHHSRLDKEPEILNE